MKSVLEMNGSENCTMCMYLMSLKCTLNNSKDVKLYVICISPQLGKIKIVRRYLCSILGNQVCIRFIGFCNKVTKYYTWWLKTRYMYSFTVLEGISVPSTYCQGHALFKTCRGRSFLATTRFW